MATITTQELALELDTTPRMTRKFLRATLDETPGKGGRYAIEKRQVRSLKAQYAKYAADQAAAKAAREEVSEEA